MQCQHDSDMMTRKITGKKIIKKYHSQNAVTSVIMYISNNNRLQIVWYFFDKDFYGTVFLIIMNLIFLLSFLLKLKKHLKKTLEKSCLKIIKIWKIL